MKTIKIPIVILVLCLASILTSNAQWSSLNGKAPFSPVNQLYSNTYSNSLDITYINTNGSYEDTVWYWNGTKYDSLIVPSKSPIDYVRSVLEYNGILYANSYNGVFGWTGTTWTQLGTFSSVGVTYLCSTPSPNYLYALYPGYVDFYNGSSWNSALGIKLPQDFYNEIMITYNNNIIESMPLNL